MGGKDFFLHGTAKDAAGLKKQHMHCGNHLEALDLHQEAELAAIDRHFVRHFVNPFSAVRRSRRPPPEGGLLQGD